MNMKDAGIIIGSIILFLIVSIPLNDTVVDDTYIHLQYARNLATDSQIAFNRGSPSYGATSPLWVFLLAAGCKIGFDILFLCHLFSTMFAVLSIVLIYYYVMCIDGRRPTAAAAAFILSAEAWFVRWSSVGMETSFVVFMVLMVLVVSLKALKSIRYSALFGLSLYLSVLARPETILLVPIAAFIFLFLRKEKFSARITWLIVFVSAYSVWLLFIKSQTGTFFPLTAGAKQGWLLFNYASFRRIVIPLKIIGATLFLPSVFIAAWILLSGTKWRGVIKEDMISKNLLLPFAWVLSLPLIYVLFDFTILSRYLSPLTPAIITLGVVSVRRIVSHFNYSRKVERWVLGLFTIFVITQNIIFYMLVVVPPTKAFAGGVNDVLVPMGKWLRNNTPEEAIVATPDIGAIGYYSERELLDLGGLVTPEINRMRDTLELERIISEGFFLEFNPDYLIDRNRVAERFAGRIIRGVKFIPIMSDTILTLGIRKPEPVVYTLYHLERE